MNTLLAAALVIGFRFSETSYALETQLKPAPNFDLGNPISHAITLNSETQGSYTDNYGPLIPEEPDENGYYQIEWDSLMPANFDGSPAIPGDQPRDLVEELIGKKVSIPGFVVPLDFDGERVHSLLFVPYVGACIHVPPPPVNQLIYAEVPGGYRMGDQWEPIQLSGTLGGEYTETEIGSAGYTMVIDKIEPFTY